MKWERRKKKLEEAKQPKEKKMLEDKIRAEKRRLNRKSLWREKYEESDSTGHEVHGEACG